MKVSGVNIASTALVAQICLTMILALATSILSSSWKAGSYLSHGLWRACVLFALVSVLPLFLTSDFLPTIAPLFGKATLAGIPLQVSLPLVYFFNILYLTLIVRRTGGSRDSPFTPMLLVLPALAIFLREPETRVVAYGALVVLGFSLGFRRTYSGRDWSETALATSQANWALWFVSVACLALTTFVGITTSPIRAGAS